MELEVWDLRPREGSYTIVNKIGGSFYKVLIQEDSWSKSVIFNVAITSGKKRKELRDFEIKDTKPGGGIKALVWCFNQVEEFIEVFKQYYPLRIKGKNITISIGWIDGQRRRVYSRLERYGYKLQQYPNGLYYTKTWKI